MRLRSTRLMLAAILVVAVIASSDAVRGQDPAVPPDKAHLQVKVPTADTVLIIGTSSTDAKGVDRLFESPKIDKGKEYYYDLTATWTEESKEKKETRKAIVKAGQKTVVDFTKPEEKPKDKDAPPKDKDTAPKDKDAAPKDKDAAPKDKDAAPKDKDAAPKDKKDKDTEAVLETRRPFLLPPPGN